MGIWDWRLPALPACWRPMFGKTGTVTIIPVRLDWDLRALGTMVAVPVLYHLFYPANHAAG
jgi:hypothetical protein